MPDKYKMCTTCGLTKSPIPPNIYVIQTDLPARIFTHHVNLQCTRDQVKQIDMCTDCFTEMMNLPAPATTKA
jgi:hypothetical protein